MLISAFLYTLDIQAFWMNLLLVFFEPAGWFSVWTGLDKLFFGVNKQDLVYAAKVEKLEVVFAPYPEHGTAAIVS